MLKLCLTGGPGAGKTVIFSHLSRVLEERGYFVFLVPDTVPELIMNGIKPNPKLSELAFQNFVLNKQLDKEKLYNGLAQYYPKDKIVIVYDKGILDIGAFVGKETLEAMLKQRRMTMVDACEHYDIVIHLVTAADGALEFYQWNDPTSITKLSNVAMESPDEALHKDKATREIWSCHPNHHIVETFPRFEDKLDKTMSIIFQALGEKQPSKVLQKFIIKTPSESFLEQFEQVSKTNIVQHYLIKHDSKIDRRVVQRGTKDNGFTFYYVEKVDVGNEHERFVTEKQITKQEYALYLSQADKNIQPVSKVRRGLVINNLYYEIETYLFDKEHAILEVAHDVDNTHSLPFTIIENVTGKHEYSSRELAKRNSFPTTKPRTLPSIHDRWIYETGREESGFGKNDTRFYSVEIVTDEAQAIKLSTERNRTYLIRYKQLDNGERSYQRYDKHSRTWLDD
jgi:hypothetical protein